MAMSLGRLGGLLGALAMLGGCGSSSDANSNGAGGGTGADQVEIFSWWVAPGEAEALQALISLDGSRHPGETILNAAETSGTDARAALATRLAANDPPDLFQLNAHDMRALIAANPGKLTALDDFYTTEMVTAKIRPEVLAEAKGVDGVLYAVPVNVHRENSLFYNMQKFSDNSLTPPTSYAELITVCDALKAAGVTPIATVYQGWIQRIMFNEIAMSTLGAKDFTDIITAAVPFDAAAQAKWQTAIDNYATVLTTYTNSNAGDSTLGWTDAATMVKDGTAAMFMHGDWAKGYLVQLGATPGVDFGQVGAPGASDLFWEDVDTFSLPVGAKNSAGAYHFLDTILSPEGQIAFNKLKGSTPMRMDIDKTLLDATGQTTYDDLTNATYHEAVRNQNAWDDGFTAFTTSMDKAALLQVYVTNPPM